MTLFRIATTILGLVGWFLFANAPASAQESPLRGTIQKVLPQDGKEIIGRILVNKQAWVFVTKKTTIFKADGKNPPKAARFEDLKAGQRVQASFTSDIRDTDPPQVDADQILIVGDNEPTIRGAITMTELKDTPRMVLVEEKAGDPNSATWVHVTADTKIFKRTGKNRKAATFADLKVSVRIEVRFNGDIAKTDPPQVVADEILILEDEKPDLRGIITKADKGEGLLGMFLIEEKGESPTRRSGPASRRTRRFSSSTARTARPRPSKISKSAFESKQDRTENSRTRIRRRQRL